MNEEQQDFSAKLTLIEWEAKLVLEELSPGAVRDRVQHIATIARLLSLKLDLGSIALNAGPGARAGASSDPPA